MVNRDRLPRWVNVLIDRIADAPTSPIGRLAARQYGRPSPRGTVPTTVFADLPLRVLIAPVNYSGQGTAWARALESSGDGISARNMAIDVVGGFRFPADVLVPLATYHNDPDWQRREFDAASAATHVLIEAEEPPFGRLLGRSVSAQATALADRGVSVAYMAHGTDVRLPSRHLRDNPWSHYNDESIYVPRAEALAARNIALLADSGRPYFVSTPDLLRDLPQAQWCPVVVDLDRWAVRRTERDARCPLSVVHAPSVSAVKGTALILPALERLAAEGIITLELVSGIPSEAMPRIFAGADVVIDQMRIGSYGVAAVEAMAAGCVVVGHVAADVRKSIARHTGEELPIVEATADTIEEELRRLAAEPSLADRRAIGQAFVAHVHDGRLAARVLTQHWIDRHPSRQGKASTDEPDR
ncbi:glycosyltransferase [Microbacterium sp. SA39]|uniref:glycosyltransferase n=1 Tax=Microbacterium sp. SA39 TaxID=1263625 RepID=UPI0005F9C234|nr:glycosyltransferase [Microbacterium sp. SA39]KJQ53664.1 hypothetical protein RS85_02696 [Microbacterium sp. SA39]